MGTGQNKTSFWDYIKQGAKDAWGEPPPPKPLTEEERRRNLERRSPPKAAAQGIMRGMGYTPKED